MSASRNGVLSFVGQRWGLPCRSSTKAMAAVVVVVVVVGMPHFFVSPSSLPTSTTRVGSEKIGATAPMGMEGMVVVPGREDEEEDEEEGKGEAISTPDVDSGRTSHASAKGKSSRLTPRLRRVG